jgi:hypothetical protein
MINFKSATTITAATAIAAQIFSAAAAEAAKRPSALAASFHGTLLDGPLAGQTAGAGAIPSGAVRHVKTPYGVAECTGGDNRVSWEDHSAPSGNQNRSCHWTTPGFNLNTYKYH